MPDTPELTIAFIKRRPESAGRVLAAMRPAVAAAFLQSIPTRFAVEAVAHMNPRPASALIRKMGVTSGAALLRDLSFAEASAILRQIEPGIRSQLLEELPRRLRRDFEMSLAFPTDTVGAHMTTAIATLSEDAKTSDALELIKQMERDHTDVILVLNDKHKLVGAVTVTSLLRHPTHISLVDQLDTSCVTLSAHARLDAVAGLDAWDDYNQLPVVSRRGEVIGTLARKAVSRAHLREHASDARAPSLAESMMDALAASAAGLAELLTPASDTAPGPGDLDER